MTNLAVAPTSDFELPLKKSKSISYVQPPFRAPTETGVSSVMSVVASFSTVAEEIGDVPAAAPEEAWYIHGKINRRFRLVRPLQVKLYWTPTGVVAEQQELNMFAFGDDRMDALVSLAERIIEDYNLVVRQGHKLSPRMQRHRDLLRRTVQASA